MNVKRGNEHVAVEGSYSYNDPNGKKIIVKYTADENGYHIIDSTPQDMEGVFPVAVVSVFLYLFI